MSIIKSGAVRPASQIRPFAAPAEQALAETPPQTHPLALELADLRRAHASALQRVAELESQLEATPAKLEQARKAGVDQGVRDGLKQAQDDQAARAAKIDAAVRSALDALDGQLVEMEGLAIEIAAASLDRILGDPSHYQDLVARIVADQIHRLKDQTVLAVELSARDFDHEALEGLRGALDRPEVALRALEAAAPGSCRLKVKLGEVEVGVDQQWGALAAVLGQPPQPGARR